MRSEWACNIFSIGIDLTTSAKVAFDSVKGCECQKGEKGSPGFVVAMRGLTHLHNKQEK